jgi:hypothetical protein
MSVYSSETGNGKGVGGMAKALEHRSVKDEASRVKDTPQTVTRRQFFRLGIAGAALVAALQGGIIGGIVSTPKTAQAQPSVKNLKPFSLKKLKELDAQMDDKRGRVYRELKDDYITRAEVTGENGIYIKTVAGVSISTKVKELDITYPRNREKPTEVDPLHAVIDLQPLYDLYEVACTDAGRKPKENPWVKIIFDVTDKGVFIHAIFVDDKPRPNDSADIKNDYPVLTVAYRKGTNDVSNGELYRRIEDENKVAQRSR